MDTEDSSENNHEARSSFIQNLVQKSNSTILTSSFLTNKIPKRIVQFWDNLDRLPSDVKECIETWRKTEEQGFELCIRPIKCIFLDNDRLITFDRNIMMYGSVGRNVQIDKAMA